MTVYNKLVRDGIPEIIRRDGCEPITRILDDGEFRPALLAKFDEELAEFKKEFSASDSPHAAVLEELADIAELIDASAAALGADFAAVLKIKSEKSAKRGGFSRRVFLEKVRDE